MHTFWCDERIAYDGSQLRAHWVLARFDIAGDACIGFRGPCRVRPDEIADLADIDGPGIAGDDLVHFVWESFAEPDLLLAVHRQRLLAVIAAEALTRLGATASVRRTGDDLWLGDRKLSISVATRTPVSAVLHFAVNATPGGAPVATATLAELGVEPRQFGEQVLADLAAELRSICEARAQVRAKGEWR